MPDKIEILVKVGKIMPGLMHAECGGDLRVVGVGTIHSIYVENLVCIKCGARDLDVSSYESVIPKGQ